MSITIMGDRVYEDIPSTESKALRINLNKSIFGTFSEIGAGQETVRNFFAAGGASRTIAKAMSAYGKEFSDAIYGAEKDGRYVTESRLRKMLSHELDLIERRIDRKENPDKLFFSFANTVATIDYTKKYQGHGWVGVRYQTKPDEDYSEITLHVRFHENKAQYQQNTLGTLGVNLIYYAYYHYDSPKNLLKHLYDHIDKDLLEIDTINFSGPCFEKVDNRLMSLELIKNGMTDAVMFDPEGNNLLISDELYGKNVLALRGSFRPVTKVNMDIYEQSKALFLKEKGVTEENSISIFEITLSNLTADGFVSDEDFLHRANLLGSMGQTVMISTFKEYYKLVEYLERYSDGQKRLAMGVDNLIYIFDEHYYDELIGGTLEAFGKLFTETLQIYLYPYKNRETGEITDSNNLIVPDQMHDLYKYFKRYGKFVDIKEYHPEYLDIFSRDVLKMIENGEPGWEEKLPKNVAELIKEQGLFGYKRI